MARRGSVLLVAFGVSLLAACSNSDDAASVTTSSTPTASSISTTTEAPTTTTEPTTTEAPTTTLDPAEALAAEVEADFREAFDALYAAVQDPSNDEKVELALSWHVESNREFIADQLNEYRINGWVATPRADFDAAVVVEAPARLVGSSGDVAELQVCEIDSWIVVEPSAGPNGSPAIVNDDLNTYRSTYFMRRTDGSWRIEGSAEIGSWLGLKECPAE